jgi:hypothetical protein
MQHSKFLLVISVLLFQRFTSVDGYISATCRNRNSSMIGFCTTTFSTLCTATGGIRSPDYSGNCGGVSSKFNEANIKNEICCLTKPYKNKEEVKPCKDITGLTCSGLGGFGSAFNKCCNLGGGSAGLAGTESLADVENLAIAYCDASGISVVTQPCKGDFTCTEYWGFTRKGKRQLDPAVYAMCELDHT